MNRTQQFLDNLERVYRLEIPEEVLQRTKLALLDYLGVTLAGRHELQHQIDHLMADFGDGGDVKAIGIDRPTTLNNAVFLNGLNGHALDFDDGTNAGIIHLGSPLFAVLLALAQKYRFTGAELLRAAVLGYEASFTMARSIQPNLKMRGYHATGVCGVLGIAVAASQVLGLDEQQRFAAFSTAAQSATGTLKVLEDASQLKPYNVGKAALMGWIAVQMACAGFETADDALSGTSGYLHQFGGREDMAFVPALLDGTYAVQKAYIKPYAACRYTHPSIDVARDLRAAGTVAVEEVERVIIRTYSLAVKKHDHTVIPGAASAKMSIPYNFAVTYVLGRTGMEAFTQEALNHPDVQALTQKVTVYEDEAMTAAFPKETIATVEMVMKDGSVHTGRSVLPKGEPENPLTEAEAIEKFTALAAYGGKTPEQAAAIVDAVMHIETELPRLCSLI